MFPDMIPIDEWGLFPKGKRPIIISGPCSAENCEMVVDTASKLKKIGVSIYRAGIWKLRTHPNTFEGVGDKGLPWMNIVQKEVGLPVATEVASAHHVEMALKYGIDLIWLGARTTVNPFATQEIANALKGTNIPVLIKNPINPEVELWQGALERVYLAGVRKLALVHRGFSFYENSRYRYAPCWQIPIEMRRRFPELPLFCDPSHISGKREYLAEISNTAMNLGYEGLIIESHPHPELALSDSAQQITPENLKILLDNLNVRSKTIDNSDDRSIIDEYRSEIDSIDAELINILSHRRDVVEKIGLLKKVKNITILQTERWSEVLQNAINKGEEKGLGKDYMEKLFQIIHQASIDQQDD